MADELELLNPIKGLQVSQSEAEWDIFRVLLSIGMFQGKRPGAPRMRECWRYLSIGIRRAAQGMLTKPDPPLLSLTLGLPHSAAANFPSPLAFAAGLWQGTQAKWHLQAAQYLLQLQKESSAFSHGEWDGKTLAEVGLCEMECFPSDSNTQCSTLASCKECPDAYDYKLWEEETTQACTAHCSPSFTVSSVHIHIILHL